MAKPSVFKATYYGEGVRTELILAYDYKEAESLCCENGSFAIPDKIELLGTLAYKCEEDE